MAGYSTSNPPRLLAGGMAGGPQLWTYSSVDAASLVRVSGYFTNGYSLGMRKNDIVIVVDSDTGPTASMHVVHGATSDSDVDLSDATTVGSATSTD